MNEDKADYYDLTIREINCVKYKPISREKIYPEFRIMFVKATGLIFLELILIYSFVFPVMAAFKQGFFNIHIINGLWHVVKQIWSFSPEATNMFLMQIGLSLAFLFFFVYMPIGYFLWFFCLFKYGIAPQLKQGEEITKAIKDVGIKMFKYFLLSISLLSVLSGMMWFVFLPAAIVISTILFMFFGGMYFDMELTRLGVPILANKMFDVINRYKQGWL